MGKTKIKVGRGILINNVKGRITIISNYDRRTLEPNQKKVFMKVNKSGKLESKSWPGWRNWINRITKQELIDIWKNNIISI